MKPKTFGEATSKQVLFVGKYQINEEEACGSSKKNVKFEQVH